MGFATVMSLIKQGDFSEAKRVMNEYIDENKIKEDDIAIVSNYYTSTRSSYAGYILYKMQCAYGQYFEAYKTYVRLLEICLRKRDISLKDAFSKADDNIMYDILIDFKEQLENDIDIPQSLIVSEIIDVLVPRINNSSISNKDRLLADIAELMWFEELKTSEYLYEIAVACLEADSELAEKLFLKVIEKEPANSIALNDIGILFEKKENYEKAKIYFGRAHNFCADNQEYKANFDRVSAKCN